MDILSTNCVYHWVVGVCSYHRHGHIQILLRVPDAFREGQTFGQKGQLADGGKCKAFYSRSEVRASAAQLVKILCSLRDTGHKWCVGQYSANVRRSRSRVVSGSGGCDKHLASMGLCLARLRVLGGREGKRPASSPIRCS